MIYNLDFLSKLRNIFSGGQFPVVRQHLSELTLYIPVIYTLFGKRSYPGGDQFSTMTVK